MANEIKVRLAVEGTVTAQDQLNRFDARLGALNGTLVKTAHYGAAMAGAFGLALPALQNTVSATIGAADAVTTLKNTLKLATGSADQAGQAYSALFDIAQKSRVSFTELGSTFASISRAGQELGISQARLLTVTQSIGNAMAIGGGSAQGMQAALVQLGQGLSSGVLRGEELNSVMEQSPRLARALADGLGVPLGELRKLGAAGQLTAEQVINALEKAGPQLAKEIESSVLTVGQAMTVLGNAAIRFVGELDQSTGASNKLAGGINAVAGAVDGASKGDGMRFWTDDFVAAGQAMDRAKLSGAGFWGQLNDGAGMLIGRSVGLGLINRDFMTLATVVADATAAIKRLDDQEKREGQLSVYSMSERANAARDLARANRELAQTKTTPELSDTQQGINANGRAREKYYADQARAVADLDALRNKLSGVPDAYLKDMAEIIRLNQAGVLVGKEYTDVLAKQQALLLKKNTPKAADDSIKTAVDAQIARYEQLQTTVTSGEKRAQEALAASRAAGLVDDQDFFTQKRDLALAANAGTQSLVNLEIKAVDSSKLAVKDKASAVVKYNGELTKLREEEIGINAKFNNELLVAAAELTKNYAEALSKALGDGVLKTGSLNAETRALEIQTQAVRIHGVAIDGTATILAREEVAILSVALATTLHNKAIAEQLGLTQEQSQNFAATIAQLTALKNVATGTANASAGKDLAQAGLDQTQRLLGNTADDPFKDWGNTLRETFATAGDGLARMVSVMGVLAESGKDYATEMSVINALRQAGGKSNLETASINEQALIERTRKDQVAAYASMAGAAKGFFKDGSDGYRLMQGIEQATHLMQMANLAEKLFTSLFVTTAEVAAKTTGNTVVAASGVASDAIQLPGAVALASARAVGAVANQGGGDPYTAFPRIAAMVAIMAGIGLMVGGGGGGGAPSVTMDAFASQQANTGTGGVLGDSTAQSESLQNSLDALESYAKPSLLFTSQMVSLLRSINTSLAGATSSLLQSGFDAFGNQFQGTSSAKGGGIMGAIFGSSSSSTSLSDLGLSFAKQSIADAMRAVSLQQYQVTRTDSTKSGFLGFGGKSSTSYNTSFGAVDEKVSMAMTQTVQQMFMLVEKAALQIGASQSQIDALQNIDTGLGKISLKDKTGKEIQELLTSVFSAMGDAMASAIAPGLKDMQLAGEGLLETFTRITNGLSITNTWARIFGRSLFDVSIQGAAAANKLAEAFGGLEQLNDQSQAFYESYYSQAEQAANSQLAVSAALASVNLFMPQTKTGLRDLASSIDQTTDSGRAAYAMLLSLAPEFSDTSDLLDELAADMAKTLLETFTGRGKLIPALSGAALAMATVSTSANTTTGALSSINSILGDASSRVIYFGSAISNVNAPLDAAQLATLALRDEMIDLSVSASGTTIDFEGLTRALANVDTRTFVATVTGVFEVIGERIKDVLSGIADERISVRDAAINIIGAGGLTAKQISQQITASMVGMPGNSGVMAAQSALSAADARAAATAAAAAAAQGVSVENFSTVQAALAVMNAANSAKQSASTAQSGAQNTLNNTSAGSQQGVRWWSNGHWVPNPAYAVAQQNLANAQVAYTQSTAAANAAITSYTSTYANAESVKGASTAAANSAFAVATAAQTAAANAAKAAQLAYIASLQQYAVDAGKAVKQLSQLRQETVNYFQTQKQLADLMNSSASSLRQTVADYRFGLMDPRDQLAQLQERFNVAYSMALSTSGDVLAGYGSEINALINPLLQKAQEAGLSGSEYAGLISTTLARADTVAARLEAMAPANYQLESLALLAQIDATLAALETGALTADQIVVNAIKAGSDTTANGLRAVIAAITGGSIPAFANGGSYAGGLAMVGENGRELINFNQPGQVYNAAQTRGMFAGGQGNTARLEALVEALTAEVSNLRAETRSIVVSSADGAKQLKRWDGEGMPTRVQPGEIFAVTTTAAV